jgi:hypothetical protein
MDPDNHIFHRTTITSLSEPLHLLRVLSDQQPAARIIFCHVLDAHGLQWHVDVHDLQCMWMMKQIVAGNREG